ncbi:MAG: hypothetical protein HN350_15655 [Phycisphaerales bacterium]|nr:hypothetical protein [Phycisphaerales bacterium]
MSLFVADWFTKDAFALGKKMGLIFTTPAILFGEDIAKALKSLIATLENAAAAATKNPDVVADLFRKLGKIEGAASNLRGPFFEMIAGHCIGQVEGGSIDIGAMARDPRSGKPAEIDVLLVKGNQRVCCYECRGHLNSVTVEVADVEKWLEQKVPIMRRFILGEDRFKRATVGFEFWTTGQFSKEAAAYLASGTDEECFQRVFGGCDWAVMFILARGGKTFARLQHNTGPGGRINIPIDVDYAAEFVGSDHEAWCVEYAQNVRITGVPFFFGRDHWAEDTDGLCFGDQWLEDLQDMEPGERQAVLAELYDRPELWDREGAYV